MTPQDFDRRLAMMDRRINKALGSICQINSLSGKLDARRKIKELRKERRDFFLSYHELVNEDN